LKEREIFSNLFTVPPIFIRLDGRGFHRLTEELCLEKPFDKRFCEAMTKVCRQLITGSGLSPLFAYTFSDEISLYCDSLPFNGRIEKINSVAASFAASALTIVLELKNPISFDARIVQSGPEFIARYLILRQQEAWRNHLNAYCQQALIGEGRGPREVADALKGFDAKTLHDMMFKRGINLSKTPNWQRRGVFVHRVKLKKDSHMGHEASANIKIERETPLFNDPEGHALISELTGFP